MNKTKWFEVSTVLECQECGHQWRNGRVIGPNTMDQCPKCGWSNKDQEDFEKQLDNKGS